MNQLILVLTALAIATSCSDDNETSEDLASSIIGSWTLTSETKSECENASDNGNESFSCSTSWCFKRTFSSDGKYLLEDRSSGVTNTVSGTYTVTGDKLELSVAASAGCGVPITIDISGSTLSLSFSKVAASDCTCKRDEIYKKEGS